MALKYLINKLILKWKKFIESEFWLSHKISKIMNYSELDKKNLGIKRTVRLVGTFGGLWRRTIEQTPNGSCQFGGTLFVASGDADYYLILNKPPDNFERPKSCRGIWGLHMEPHDYIKKFGYEATLGDKIFSKFFTNSDDLIKRGGVYTPSPPYVHFHIGKSWDYLYKIQRPKKTVDVGIIVSDLIDLEGHRKRLDFIKKIDESDLDIAIWGRGEGLNRYKNYKGYVWSKWEAYEKCKYTIVIENSYSDYYWTEKLVDSILAYSLPFYYGGKLAEKYIPSDAFIPIDIDNENVLDYIKKCIKNNSYESKISSIDKARIIILKEQNLYSFIDRELDVFDC